MADSLNRRRFLATTGAAATAVATSAVHAADTKNRYHWKMVTSWPQNSPGPGVTAQRLVDRIEAMSGGRLRIKLFAAGELVPAFLTFDAAFPADVLAAMRRAAAEVLETPP